MVPPWPWAPATPPLPTAFILSDGGFRICHTRKPPRLHTPHMVGEPFGFLGLGDGRGIALLLGQLNGVHHHKAQGFLGHPPITILYGDLDEMTLCPCQWRGASSWVRPGFSTSSGNVDCCCPHASNSCRTAQVRGNEGDQADPFFQAQPSRSVDYTPDYRPRCRGLPRAPARDTASMASGVSTLSLVLPSRMPTRRGSPPSPLTPRLSKHLLEIITAIFTMPIRWAWWHCDFHVLGRLRDRSSLPLIGPIQGNRRGILMEPGSGMAYTSKALRATAPDTWLRLAANKASRICPRR